MTFFNLILAAILLVVAIILSVQFYYIIFLGYVPFISTKKNVIKRIAEEISPKDSDIIYELGCGQAGFLRVIEKKFPQVRKLIGIEYFFMPYLIAGIQLSLNKSKIKLIKDNFYNIDLKDANIIYCFLGPSDMEKLKEKFKKECRPGTQIISYQFSMHGLNPEKVVDMNNDKKDRVYFYKI